MKRIGNSTFKDTYPSTSAVGNGILATFNTPAPIYSVDDVTVFVGGAYQVGNYTLPSIPATSITLDESPRNLESVEIIMRRPVRVLNV